MAARLDCLYHLGPILTDYVYLGKKFCLHTYSTLLEYFSKISPKEPLEVTGGCESPDMDDHN